MLAVVAFCIALPTIFASLLRIFFHSSTRSVLYIRADVGGAARLGAFDVDHLVKSCTSRASASSQRIPLNSVQNDESAPYY